MGFDWVLIDCEHGTIGVEAMEVMVMAARRGHHPIVRPRTNSSDILQAMDRGAGVQVPHVNTAGERARAFRPSSSTRSGRGLAWHPAGHGSAFRWRISRLPRTNSL
jgi:2-keto-3-deoxy-L-rhamnonate aldolase RhmA